MTKTTTATTTDNGIEILTLLSVTSLTRQHGMWVHRDLKGREFNHRLETLSSAELLEQTTTMDYIDGLDNDAAYSVDPDFDAADEGFAWERAALDRAAFARADLY